MKNDASALRFGRKQPDPVRVKLRSYYDHLVGQRQPYTERDLPHELRKAMALARWRDGDTRR